MTVSYTHLKKLRKAINDEKALQHQLKQLTRKERTHRLCTRCLLYTSPNQLRRIMRLLAQKVVKE